MGIILVMGVVLVIFFQFLWLPRAKKDIRNLYAKVTWPPKKTFKILCLVHGGSIAMFLLGCWGVSWLGGAIAEDGSLGRANPVAAWLGFSQMVLLICAAFVGYLWCYSFNFSRQASSKPKLA